MLAKRWPKDNSPRLWLTSQSSGMSGESEGRVNYEKAIVGAEVSWRIIRDSVHQAPERDCE